MTLATILLGSVKCEATSEQWVIAVEDCRCKLPFVALSLHTVKRVSYIHDLICLFVGLVFNIASTQLGHFVPGSPRRDSCSGGWG